MKIATYLPSLRFLVMVLIAWVLITLVARYIPKNNTVGAYLTYLLGYKSDPSVTA
jgi:hypothetical protein